MDFQERFAQVLCSLFSVLHASSSHTGDLLSEEMNYPKALPITEINPLSKFWLGPFESVDDRFYNFTYYMNSMLNGKKIIEKVNEFEAPGQVKTENQEISNWKSNKGNEDFEKDNGDQQPNQHQSRISGILQQINNLKRRMKKLQMISQLLEKIETKEGKTENSTSVDSFVKLLKKIASDDKMENKIKVSGKNEVNSMNNIINNNRYLIGNIFIINLLSEENNSSLKETDVEILKALTDRKMKELLEKAVNNSGGDGIPTVVQPPQHEMDFLKELQGNFSKMFNHQNVTLKHVNQMSKIIDFVQRYHGTIGKLRPWGIQKKTGNIEEITDNITDREISYDEGFEDLEKKKEKNRAGNNRKNIWNTHGI